MLQEVMMARERPYNPLDYDNLGESVADALLERQVFPLDSLQPFIGAGIYAIYYEGGFPLYATVAQRNREDNFTIPIYVGKAIPSGGRKGGRVAASQGQPLYRRLIEHATSIEQASNLGLKDFHCRYLVVDDIWIPLGESLIIERFQPIWNVMMDGFGNHDPGKGRYQGKRPAWDTIHPGRGWAERLQPNQRTADEITVVVNEALAKRFT